MITKILQVSSRKVIIASTIVKTKARAHPLTETGKQGIARKIVVETIKSRIIEV